MINKSQLISALTANHMYEQNMVYAIDEQGREQLITSFSDFCKVQKQNHSIKIERMENFNSTIYEYMEYCINTFYSIKKICFFSLFITSSNKSYWIFINIDFHFT